MISKQSEYKAEVLKISGFAMLAPFGRLFFEPAVLLKECGVCFFVYVIISTAIGILGLTFILRGNDLLNENGEK